MMNLRFLARATSANHLSRCSTFVSTAQASKTDKIPLLALLGIFLAGAIASAGETRDEPWLFVDDGSRDPFTLHQSAPVKQQDDRSKEEKKAQDKSEDLEGIYEEAAQAFMENDPLEAVRVCSKGLGSFPKEDQKTDDSPVYLKLIRLRLAADRLATRERAERSFRDLSLRLSGVIVQSNSPRAIIEDQIVGVGNVLAAKDETVVVDKILPGRVVLRFRGYAMELTMSP